VEFCSVCCSVVGWFLTTQKLPYTLVGLHHSSHKIASSVEYDAFVRETVIVSRFGSENGDLSVNYNCTKSLNGFFPTESHCGTNYLGILESETPQKLLLKKRGVHLKSSSLPTPKKNFPQNSMEFPASHKRWDL